MRICSNCGEIYPEGAEVCELDATPLSSWEEATRVVLGPADEASTSEFARRTLPELEDDSTVERPTVPRFTDYADRGALPDELTRPGSLAALHVVTAPGEDGDGGESGPVEEPTDVKDPKEPLRGAARTSPPGATPTPGSPDTGRILGQRYRLLELMSIGGFGAVFAAEDMRLKKRVAVKVLSPHLATSPDHLARFQQEAIAASQLRHEGIVLVTDFDRDVDGTHFIAMELLDGYDLAQMIETHGPLPPVTALEIAAQVASALDCAHRCGILHRDLKPANVFLTTHGARGDVVKILDFGISKVMHRRLGPGNLTQTGQVVGTPYYMAPEQAQGRPDIDGRCDVYSLGVLLYEMLTGAPPFVGDHYVVVALQHLTLAPQPPSRSRPELTPDLDELVLRALAKEPRDRYESMAHFHAAIAVELHALQSGEVTEPVVDEPPPELPPLIVDEGEDTVTTDDWTRSRRRRVSTLPYSSGQVSLPIHRPRRSHRRPRMIAAGAAGRVAAGALALLVGVGVEGDGVQAGGRGAGGGFHVEATPDAATPAAAPVDAGPVVTPIQLAVDAGAVVR
jgi:serine/threonine protein kinase